MPRVSASPSAAESVLEPPYRGMPGACRLSMHGGSVGVWRRQMPIEGESIDLRLLERPFTAIARGRYFHQYVSFVGVDGIKAPSQQFRNPPLLVFRDRQVEGGRAFGGNFQAVWCDLPDFACRIEACGEWGI